MLDVVETINYGVHIPLDGVDDRSTDPALLDPVKPRKLPHPEGPFPAPLSSLTKEMCP